LEEKETLESLGKKNERMGILENKGKKRKKHNNDAEQAQMMFMAK